MKTANFIRPKEFYGEICPLFRKKFNIDGDIKKATLYASARGIYFATINGKKIGNQLFAPGWTAYRFRFQVQEYDITELIEKENDLQILLAKGWYIGRVAIEDNSLWDLTDNEDVLIDDGRHHKPPHTSHLF